MTQDILLEKLNRYESALQQIAQRVAEQTALEEHQQRVRLPSESILSGRAYAYMKIAPIAGDVLECYSNDQGRVSPGMGRRTLRTFRKA